MDIIDNTEHALDFDALVDTEADFYGVDGNCFKLDDVVYEVVEDEDRDCLDEVRICHEKHRFHISPIARVVIENGAMTDDIYDLTDLHDGHCWLSFGTEYHDTSEHSSDTEFVFDSTPKALLTE